MAGYTRQSTYTDGDVINAADSNDEFDQLLAAFNNSTGHKHDGTAAEGPVIGLIGDPGITTPLNKVVIDNPNNQIEFSVDVASSSVEQFVVKDGVIEPTTDNDIDLGSSGKEFKDLYIDGVAYVDSIAMPTTTVTDILDEDTLSSDSDTALATQQSIKAYVDSQVTAQDLDFQADTGGALSIDLDSETMTFTGGTGIDTTGSGNTVTFAIDSTVATLAGSQTLTNKTIDADNNTVSNIEVDNLKSGVLDTDLTTVAATDTTLASAKAIKTYVDAQVTAQDLDFQADTGGALNIDLDSETLTFTGGTGIDTSGSGNAVTFAIDSTVATLTGTQTLTNKTLTSPTITTPTLDLSGVTSSGDLAVADGGTAASTAAGARTNLGVAIGSDVQAYDAGLASIAGLTTAADKAIYTTASDTYAVTDLTAFGRSLIDDADAAAGRTTLGLGTAATSASTDFVAVTGDSMTGNLSFGDNDKAIFGAGSDLQLYHDGTNSYVQDAGTGDLRISGNNVNIMNGAATENYIVCTNNGSVAVKYDNATKVETTTSGIDVTGTVTADGATIASLTYPISDGTSGQVLTTNGAGTLSFQPVTETDPSALAFAIALG